MNYHRWISVGGCEMTVIDVKAYKQYRWMEKIKLGIIRLVTIWSILAIVAPMYQKVIFA